MSGVAQHVHHGEKLHSHSLDTVGEEVRFVCLHNDHIKEVSPAFPHHVRHSSVTAHTQ